VRSAWWDTAYALGFVREFYRTLGPQRLYDSRLRPAIGTAWSRSSVPVSNIGYP
jgi:hypothetical protein